MAVNHCPIHDVSHRLVGHVAVCPLCLGTQPLWRVLEVYDQGRLRTYRIEERDLTAKDGYEWRTVAVCMTLGEAHLNVQTRAMALGWSECLAVEYDALGRAIGVPDCEPDRLSLD